MHTTSSLSRVLRLAGMSLAIGVVTLPALADQIEADGPVIVRLEDLPAAPAPNDPFGPPEPTRLPRAPGTTSPAGQAARASRDAGDDADRPALPPGTLAIRLLDGGSMHARLAVEQLTLVTPYGRLEIPVADILRIRLGMRLTSEQAQRIAAATAELGHEDFQQREAAMVTLTEFGLRAYPALRDAAGHDDAEVCRRAKLLIEKLTDDTPIEELESLADDVVYTAKSKIAGRLDADTLAIKTDQFGDLELRLADVREMRGAVARPAEPKDGLPDPGTLSQYANQIGKTFVFRITGPAQPAGSVWGTDVYTYDSHLATCALHAGAVKPGQTRNVRVRIVGPVNSFLGTTRHGITSSNYSSYPAGFEFVK